jgi:hypothetical protein
MLRRRDAESPSKAPAAKPFRVRNGFRKVRTVAEATAARLTATTKVQIRPQKRPLGASEAPKQISQATLNKLSQPKTRSVPHASAISKPSKCSTTTTPAEIRLDSGIVSESPRSRNKALLAIIVAAMKEATGFGKAGKIDAAREVFRSMEQRCPSVKSKALFWVGLARLEEDSGDVCAAMDRLVEGSKACRLAGSDWEHGCMVRAIKAMAKRLVEEPDGLNTVRRAVLAQSRVALGVVDETHPAADTASSPLPVAADTASSPLAAASVQARRQLVFDDEDEGFTNDGTAPSPEHIAAETTSPQMLSPDMPVLSAKKTTSPQMLSPDMPVLSAKKTTSPQMLSPDMPVLSAKKTTSPQMLSPDMPVLSAKKTTSPRVFSARQAEEASPTDESHTQCFSPVNVSGDAADDLEVSDEEPPTVTTPRGSVLVLQQVALRPSTVKALGTDIVVSPVRRSLRIGVSSQMKRRQKLIDQMTADDEPISMVTPQRADPIKPEHHTSLSPETLRLLGVDVATVKQAGFSYLPNEYVTSLGQDIVGESERHQHKRGFKQEGGIATPGVRRRAALNASPTPSHRPPARASPTLVSGSKPPMSPAAALLRSFETAASRRRPALYGANASARIDEDPTVATTSAFCFRNDSENVDGTPQRTSSFPRVSPEASRRYASPVETSENDPRHSPVPLIETQRPSLSSSTPPPSSSVPSRAMLRPVSSVARRYTTPSRTARLQGASDPVARELDLSSENIQDPQSAKKTAFGQFAGSRTDVAGL